MPRVFAGESVAIHAETGAGKTLAYLAPLLARSRRDVPRQVLVLVCLVLTPVLAYIPTATLDGLFLFMGASSLPTNAIWQRAKLAIQQKDILPPEHFLHEYDIPLAKVHFYTVLQVVVVVFLFRL